MVWGFPKIKCTCLGVPIIRTRVFWGLHWGLPILGNYRIYSSWYVFGSRFGADNPEALSDYASLYPLIPPSTNLHINP